MKNRGSILNMEERDRTMKQRTEEGNRKGSK